MKKLILILIVVLSLTSCADDKIIDGKIAKTYGWANTADRNDSVAYRVCMGNVFWSIIFCETIFVPIWLTGWELYEPVESLKPDTQIK